jgi:excisionase family DNA binding protein
MYCYAVFSLFINFINGIFFFGPSWRAAGKGATTYCDVWRPMTDRLLISQREACQRLGISRPTLVGEIKAGRLRYVLVGKRRKFRQVDLETYVERQARGCDGTEIWSPGSRRRRPAMTSGIRSREIGFDEALRLTGLKLRNAATLTWPDASPRCVK